MPHRGGAWVAPGRSRLPIERRLTTRMGVWFASIALVCLAAVALLGAVNRQLTEASAAGRQATELSVAATRTATLIVDAETGLRGYSLVQEPRFLEPYRHAVDTLPGELAKLQRLANQPGDAERVATLMREADAYLTDYAAPLARRLEQTPAAGRQASVLDAGKVQVDRIRHEADQVVGGVTMAGTIETQATDAAARATSFLRIASAAVVLIVLLLAGAVFFLDRFVAAPIAKIGIATRRLQAGDLGARIDLRHGDEVGTLGDAFNGMAAALEESMSTSSSQRDELAQARDRAALYARVAEQLSERPSVVDQAETLLAAVVEMTDSAVGSVYGISAPNDDRFHLLSRLGIGPDLLPEEAIAGTGQAGRALASGRPVQVSRHESDLEVDSFGVRSPALRELHVPMLRDGRAMGVLSLGRSHDDPFSPDEVSAAVHLADHAAASLANAIETLRSRRLADLKRAVLDASGDAIHLEGPGGETILSNAAMARFRVDVLGLSPDAAEHDRAVVLATLADRTADPAGFRARLAQAYDEPDFEGSDEYELVDTHRWVYRYTAPVRSSDGTLIGRIFVMRDTTVARQAEQAKDDLMSTVSHELRTPLSAIIGFTELLLHRPFPPAEQREYLGTVLEQSNRLADLIADFLDLQRLQHGEFRPEPQEVDLLSIVASEVELFRGQSHRHTLTAEGVGSRFVASGNADQLRRVTANLLSNAIKYSPEGGAIAVAVEHHDDALTVSVTDHGLGIAADDKDRVFDRFFRVDSSATRPIGGTGLGLALVRELVEAGGGTVGVDSEEGRGSRFWFAVPAAH